MWETIAADGSLHRMAMAILAIALSALAERGWLAVRWQPYFAAGIPLLENPLPLAQIPTADSGSVPGLRWERLPEGDGARWWADANTHGFPRGLHGMVWFGPAKRQVLLAVRWSPPWTPLLAMGWLAIVGAVDGQGWFTGPLALVLAVALLSAYQRQAVRAAAHLRYGWAKEEP